jgi:hypothetical protein
MAITAEARFVTLCAREPDAVSDAELCAAAAVCDWPAVVQAAGRHRVAALVERACARSGVALPDAVGSALRGLTLGAVAHAMLLDAELERVIAAFAAQSLPAIVLKGPCLARTIYPTRILRPYGDLDLTVRAVDEARAAAALEACGLSEIPFGAEEARRAHAVHVHHGAGFHRQFLAASTGALVELHLDPLQLGLQPACEEGRWRRARALPDLPNALMLSPEDQLVHLAVHAHKHGFERLIWLKDIDLLLRAHGRELDWALSASVAQREGVTASVWYTLRLTRALLATPVSGAAIARFQPPAPIRLLYRMVWPAGRVGNLSGHMRRRAVQFHAAESLRGMLPNVVLMGRRRDRLRAVLSYLQRQRRITV